MNPTLSTPIGSTTISGPITAGTTDVPYSVNYNASACIAGDAVVKIGTSTAAGAGQCVCDDVVSLNAPLPIELAYFRAKDLDCNAHLTWKTQSEINSSYFDIEHSTDGEDFSFVQRIEATGNSQEPNLYSYTHTGSANSTNYYRLNMVDRNGHFEYSNIISFNSSCEQYPSLAISPVPVKGAAQLTLDFYADPNESYNTLYIFNVSGTMVKTLNIPFIQDGRNRVKISVDDLVSGVYYIQGIGKEVGRFIVMN